MGNTNNKNDTYNVQYKSAQYRVQPEEVQPNLNLHFINPLTKNICKRLQQDTWGVDVQENTLYDDPDTYQALAAVEIDFFQTLEKFLFTNSGKRFVSAVISKDLAETLANSRELSTEKFEVKITQPVSPNLTFFHSFPKNREVRRITITKQ